MSTLATTVDGLKSTNPFVIGWENIELISDRKFEIWLDEFKEAKDAHPEGILIASVMEEYNKDAWCEIIERCHINVPSPSPASSFAQGYGRTRGPDSGSRIHLIPSGDLKKPLGKAVRKPTLATNEKPVISPETAVYRCGMGIFLTETPLPELPKHFFRPPFPPPPLFSASGPATRSFNGLHPKNKLFAIKPRSG
jgi:hypothetical protein